MNILERSKDRYARNLKRHEKLIRSAIRVFGRKNYAAATTAEISKEAGVSEAIIYKHFESKEALFLACFREITRDLVTLYRSAYENWREDPLGSLEEIGRRFFRYVQSDQDVTKFLGNMVADSYDPKIRTVFREFMQRNIAIVEEILLYAQQSGDIDKGHDAKTLAYSFVAQFHAVILAKELELREVCTEEGLRNFLPWLRGK